MEEPQLTRRTYAYLRITGPGTHETVTSALKLSPSNAWNIGDVNVHNGRPQKFMAWTLKSGLDDTRPLEEHVRALLTLLGVRREQVRELWPDYRLTLQCVGHFPSSCGSGAHFDREVVREAGFLGLDIDLDHYFLDDHGHGA